MRHGMAEAYATIGTLAVAGVLTLGYVATTPCTQSVKSPQATGDSRGGDLADGTVGTEGDRSATTGEGTTPSYDARPFSDEVAPDAPSMRGRDDASNRHDPGSGKATKPMAIDVTKEQRASLLAAVRKGFGRDARLVSVSYEPLHGDDGNRLEVVAYAPEDGVESGQALATAFGMALRQASGTAGKGFDDLRILSLTVSGASRETMAEGATEVISPADAPWFAIASIDIPSVDGESLGDVNRVSASYGKEPVRIDMTRYGFSSLPHEE